MKLKKLWIIIPIILLTAVIFYTAIMTTRCEATLPPNDLMPEEIIYRLADYWNTGNERGISMLCAEDNSIAVSEMPYSFSEDVLRKDVKISQCVRVYPETENTLIYPEYYDKHYYKAVWNCEDSYEIDWRSGGFAFFLIAKESEDENAPYKICSMFTGL